MNFESASAATALGHHRSAIPDLERGACVLVLPGHGGSRQ